jgi:hypothetical protein
MPLNITDNPDTFPANLTVPEDGEPVDGDSWETFGQGVGNRTGTLRKIGQAYSYFTFVNTSVANGGKCPLLQVIGSGGITTDSGDIEFTALGIYEIHYEVVASGEIDIRADYNGVQVGPVSTSTGGQVSGHLMFQVTNVAHVFNLVNVSGGSRTPVGTVTIKRVS